MTPAGGRIMAELLSVEIESGRVEVRGMELFLAGQCVRPMLEFEPVSTEQGTVPDPVDTSDEEQEPDEMALKFASLPKERLILQSSTAGGSIRHDIDQDRQRVAQQGTHDFAAWERGMLDRRRQALARASAWDGRGGISYAPLPADDLVQKRFRDEDAD
jgi:hypothetical protein